MTQPRLAQSTPTGRMYARREGGDLEVPSITTIIGCEAVSYTHLTLPTSDLV